MRESNLIALTVNRKKLELDIRTIQYIFMDGNTAEIHVSDGQVLKTLRTLESLEKELGDEFLRIHRSRLVAVRAIHDITDKINLNNGERLDYVANRKKALVAELQEKRRTILERFSCDRFPKSEEDYHTRYQIFDELPIAFTDIELVLGEEETAVDWIFRYANAALAQLEKLPLEQLVGKNLSSIFPNLDTKWLRIYERAALYGQTVEIVDYRPEIDTYLSVICFPTTSGHCGCILLDISQMYYAENQGDSQNAKLRFLAKVLERIG